MCTSGPQQARRAHLVDAAMLSHQATRVRSKQPLPEPWAIEASSAPCSAKEEPKVLCPPQHSSHATLPTQWGVRQYFLITGHQESRLLETI